MLESAKPEHASEEAIQSAKMHGIKRYQQGYTIPLLATEVRLLEQAVYDVIHEHMRSLNLSYFMFDLKRLNASFGIQLEHAQIAFLNVEERIRHQS
jgi:hypothetical protein